VFLRVTLCAQVLMAAHQAWKEKDLSTCSTPKITIRSASFSCRRGNDVTWI